MRDDDYSTSEHDAGRAERMRVSDDFTRIGGTWWLATDVPARSDLEDQ